MQLIFSFRRLLSQAQLHLSLLFGEIASACVSERRYGLLILVAISSTKGHRGHSLGATSSVEFVATMLALWNGRIPATLGLDKVLPDWKILIWDVATRARHPRTCLPLVAMLRALPWEGLTNGVARKLVLESFEGLEQWRKKDVALTAYFEITQQQVDQFAAVSLDRQWIHVDAGRAMSESPFKGTISHGLLNLSVAVHFLMSGFRMDGVRYGLVTALNYARFLSVVPVGSQVRGRIRLEGCERLKDSNQAVWTVVVERKGGMIPACIAEFVVRYYA